MRNLLPITALVAVLVLAGCGEKFNAPFIDTVETLQLRPQMTMEATTASTGRRREGAARGSFMSGLGRRVDAAEAIAQAPERVNR